MAEKMQELREMPRSILKLGRGEAQEETECVPTQESAKSVTFEEMVEEREKSSDNTSELQDTQEVLPEKSISRLTYKSADKLVRTETKQVVQTRVSEKTFLNYIEEKNILSEQKIANLNTTISEYTKLSEKLTHSLQADKYQETIIRNKVKDIGDGICILKEYHEKMVAGFRETKNRTEKIINKIPVRKNEIIESIENYKKKLKELNETLHNISKPQKEQSSVEELRKKAAILREKLKEIKEKNNKLTLELEDINRSKASATETLQNLKNNKDEILNSVSSIKLKLEELHVTLADKEEENLSLKAEFELLKTASEEGIQLALEKKTTVESHLQKIRDEIQNKVDSVSRLEEQNFDAQDEIRRLETELENATNKFQNAEENFRIKTSSIDEKLAKTKKDLEEALNKKKISLEELDDLKTKYLTLRERENQLMVTKIEEENEFRQTERSLHDEKCRYEALVEKYATRKTVVEELTKNRKILEEQLQEKQDLRKKLSESSEERLNNNKKTLEDLEKKKEYLKSSQVYLRDKLESLKEETEEIQAENEKAKMAIEEEKKEIKIEEVVLELTKEREEYEKLLDDQITMPPSILKSPRKTPATSPKKVTFHGVPSSSEESLKPETREETFDDFIKRLETLAASRPKQPPTKKRRVDFE